MSPRLASLFLLPALATGCLGDDHPTSLAEVTNLEMHVVGEGTDGVVSTLTVHIRGEEWCILAHRDLVAVMPGIAGHAIYGGDASDDLCATPIITLVLAESAWLPDQVLRISDPSLEVDVELGDLLVPRAATLLEPADRVMRTDTEIAATWSPASDVGRLAFSSLLGAGSATLSSEPDGQLRGYRPRPLDATATELGLSAHAVGPLPCSDDASCHVDLRWTVPFAVTIAR